MILTKTASELGEEAGVVDGLQGMYGYAWKLADR